MACETPQHRATVFVSGWVNEESGGVLTRKLLPFAVGSSGHPALALRRWERPVSLVKIFGANLGPTRLLGFGLEEGLGVVTVQQEGKAAGRCVAGRGCSQRRGRIGSATPPGTVVCEPVAKELEELGECGSSLQLGVGDPVHRDRGGAAGAARFTM